MQVVILSGGNGSRFNADNFLKPKPMIEIGNVPIIVHIMEHFSHYGFNDFIIALGTGQMIVKNYFANYCLHTSDIEFNLSNNTINVLNTVSKNWKVKLIYTGDNTLPAGRLKRLEKYIENDNFFIVYGDSLCNINLNNELDFHIKHNKIFTLATAAFRSQKGVIEYDENNTIVSFREKSDNDISFVNTGYMVSKRKIFDYISGDYDAFDVNIFPRLMKEEQLFSYVHSGFWHPVEIQKDIADLNKMCFENNMPWTQYL